MNSWLRWSPTEVNDEIKDSGQLDESAWKARLDAGGNELGIDLDPSQLDLLWRYGVMLRERNAQVNLTSIVSPEGILTLHMLDSLSVAPHLGDAQRLIDVGTGGGFPGIPLAVAFPKRHFTLIDGTQKKIRFVAEAVAALDIRNVQASAARAEDFEADQEFDVVILRAVSSLAEALRHSAHLLRRGGRLLAMKGRLPDEQLRAVPRGWRAKITRLRVPGLDAERHLVEFQRSTG
jgi:16S rRNA (guanine527-N7)-methyltransferase